MNITQKEFAMGHKLILQTLVRLWAALSITKKVSALLDRQQGPQVLATVSWNR
jgi:hypothetical protein